MFAAQSLDKVPPAQGQVTVVAADFGLRAMAYRRATGIDAQVHCRLAPAMAHRLQFDQRIGEPQQRRRSGEQLALEIGPQRSEEHTSELQSLMRSSYAVFCLTKKKKKQRQHSDKR